MFSFIPGFPRGHAPPGVIRNGFLTVSVAAFLRSRPLLINQRSGALTEGRSYNQDVLILDFILIQT